MKPKAEIKLKHVNAFADRYGRTLHYFRRKGAKAIPLPGRPGSDDFMAAYTSALATVPDSKAIGAKRTEAGTVNALIVSFYDSATWDNLADASKTTFRPVIERFRARDGNKRVALLRREHVGLILAAINNPSARDKTLKVIRMLMGHAIETSLRTDDPTAGIKVALPKSTGHHSWTDDEIARFRAHWPLGTSPRLVMEFALETASRRSEVVRLGPGHVKIVKGKKRIEIERCYRSRDVSILVTAALSAAIDAMPATKVISIDGNQTYIADHKGRQLTPDRLAKLFVAWVTEAGLPAVCRLHGLKKGGMRRLAESGATTKQMMGVSGHKTLAMVQLYSDAADQLKLADAAIDKLEGREQKGA